MTNYLRQLPKRTLLRELLRREAEEQERVDGRERKARWRMRQLRKKAVEEAEQNQVNTL